MSTQMRSIDMALPPPPAMDLLDGERTVGWVTGSGFGFHGFANESEAAGAAWVAYRAVARALARRAGERQTPIDVEPLSLARIDGREAILASNREIATLVRPGDDGRRQLDSFGFELEFPSLTDELSLRSMAYVGYRTLRRSGVRWAMWMPEAARNRRRSSAKDAPSNPEPSASSFIAKFLLAGIGIAIAIALIVSAPRTVTLPLLFVLVAYSIGAGIASMAVRHRERSQRARAGTTLIRDHSDTDTISVPS